MALSPTCSPRCHPWCSPRCHPIKFHATLPLSFSYLFVTRFCVSPDSTCHPIPRVTRFHVSAESSCFVHETTGRSSRPTTEPYLAAHSMLLAHAYTAERYRKQFAPTQKGLISIALGSEWVEPKSESAAGRPLTPPPPPPMGRTKEPGGGRSTS